MRKRIDLKLTSSCIMKGIHVGAFMLLWPPLGKKTSKEDHVVTPMIGQTMIINNFQEYINRWWRDLK